MTLSSTHSYVESFPIIRDGTFFSFIITPLSGCQGAEGKFSTLLVALLATKGGGGRVIPLISSFSVNHWLATAGFWCVGLVSHQEASSGTRSTV